MADKAISKSSVSIFLDEVKSKLGGNLNYEPSKAMEKWIYKEVSATTSSTVLLTTSQAYFVNDGTFIHANDKVKWIAIKNTSTTPTDGVCICIDGGTAAYDLVDGIFIGAGEIAVLKIPNTTTANLKKISVTMDGTYGYPTGAGTTAITTQVAAIVEDVA